MSGIVGREHETVINVWLKRWIPKWLQPASWSQTKIKYWDLRTVREIVWENLKGGGIVNYYDISSVNVLPHRPDLRVDLEDGTVGIILFDFRTVRLPFDGLYADGIEGAGFIHHIGRLKEVNEGRKFRFVLITNRPVSAYNVLLFADRGLDVLFVEYFEDIPWVTEQACKRLQTESAMERLSNAFENLDG